MGPTDEGLPLAGGARVTGELAVGEEAELPEEGRLDLADVGAVAGEEGPLQESLHGREFQSATSPAL